MTEQSDDSEYSHDLRQPLGANVPAIAATTSTLSTLSEIAFHEIVNADVRGTLDSGTSALLREPENVPRWHDTLLSMKRSVEAQLTAKKGELAGQRAEYLGLGDRGRPLWAQAQASAEKWRQGAIRFKNGVEDKVAESKHLRSTIARDEYVKELVRERETAVRESLRLRTAIIEHRASVLSGDDSDEVDDRLWGALE